MGYAAADLISFLENVEVFRSVLPSRLNFPKFHALGHYLDTIREIGVISNTDTQATEVRHKHDVKEAWRASNRRDAILQMLFYVARRRGLATVLRWLGREKIQISDSLASFVQLGSKDADDPEYDPEEFDNDHTELEEHLTEIGDEGESTEGDQDSGNVLDEADAAEEEDAYLDAVGIDEDAHSPHQLKALGRWVAIGVEARRLGLRGLVTAIRVHLWTTDILRRDPDANTRRLHRPETSRLPRPDGDVMRIAQSISLRIPGTWDEGESAVQIIRCTDDWFKTGVPRRDAVLLRHLEGEGHHGVDVARTVLVFQVIYKGEHMDLAYVRHFRKVSPSAECPQPKIRMSAAEGEVVDIDTIERAAHLVPVWEFPYSGEVEENVFYLNTHIDRHMFFLIDTL